MRVKRKCSECGNQFWAVVFSAKYCKKECQKVAHLKLQKEWRTNKLKKVS